MKLELELEVLLRTDHPDKEGSKEDKEDDISAGSVLHRPLKQILLWCNQSVQFLNDCKKLVASSAKLDTIIFCQTFQG